MTNHYSFQVQWGDTDAAGIVFYPNFYRWMDNATHEFFAEKGLSTVTMFEDMQLGLPILEAHCEFKSAAFFGDQLEITSKVSDIRNKVFRIEHTFQRDGANIAEGYEVRAWTELGGDKPKAQPIPEEIREKLRS